MQQALKQVKSLTGLHGRWDILHENPLVITDVGHNEEGMKAIAKQIENTSHEELHIIIGIVKDKAVEKILAHLPVMGNYYFTRAQIPRALPEAELARIGRINRPEGKKFSQCETGFGSSSVKSKHQGPYPDLWQCFSCGRS